MSKSQDQALRLMLIDDSVEEAEGIVSGLRNAGIAVRPLRPTGAAELSSLLNTQIVDLVLASEPCPGLPLKDVQQHVIASGKDIPVIPVVERVDADTYAEPWPCATSRRSCWPRSSANASTWTPAAACAVWRPRCAKPSGAATR